MKIIKGIATASSLLIFVAATALPAMADMGVIYGTVNIKGHSRHARFHFNAPVPGDGVIVLKSVAKAHDEGHSGTHRRDNDRDLYRDNPFRQVKIKFNGEEVVAQRHITNGATEFRYNVALKADNNMNLKVVSCKDCTVQLTVLGNTAAPPPTLPTTAPALPTTAPALPSTPPALPTM